MKAFLHIIPDNAKILVVGGGTGKIIIYLEDLSCQLEIDFVEPSANMIKRAKKRQASHLQVYFHHHPILELETADYDVIFTNFFFDQFSQDQAQLIVQHLKPKLRPNGSLIFSDFVNTNYFWDRLITRLMFYFFQITANIRVNTLPCYNSLFSELGFNENSSKKISRNIIATTYSLAKPN